MPKRVIRAVKIWRDMSKYKIAGCCTICDTKLHEVLAVYESHHPRAGEPKSLGPAIADAVRVTFGLYDGTRADFSFCKDCNEQLNESQYIEIWDKAIRSFVREGSDQNSKHMQWFLPLLANGLLGRLGTILLKDLEGKK